MILQGLTGLLNGRLSRFLIVGLVPMAFLTTFVVGLFLLGDPPAWPNLTSVVGALSGMQMVVLILGITVAALVAHPLQLPLVRLLEGYWAWYPVGLLRPADWAVRRQRRRLERFQERAFVVEAPPRQGAGRPAEAGRRETREQLRLRRAEYAAQCLDGFPAPERLLPTRLGNTLRAAEEAVSLRYGLDAVALWPMLHSVMSPSIREAADDQRDQMDFLTRISVVTFVSALLALVVLRPVGDGRWPWLVIPVVLLLVSRIAYLASVIAAAGYGRLMMAAFDLHRFDLLRALHLPLPKNSDHEKTANRALSGFFVNGDDIVYSHSPAEPQLPPRLHGTVRHQLRRPGRPVPRPRRTARPE
ncbi:hypothetical protein ADK70_17820 [Streptomyces rimosus subsp. pseudoverticillatus]|uniref:hypothetical protein n=1 Tax=Streptomyces rimosus TaxID=1927 RepID=UPI0006B25AFD|nr:hypothetical protein [Streptomyces rimosus]KOT90133.1 hypothetical protein ADK70_17820 [Streptomyces rimosus subsp. pseudoverticillatus]